MGYTLQGEVMSVLTGPAILQAIDKKEIEIDPFNMVQTNPTSYDLRLGNKVRMYCPSGCESSTVAAATRGYAVLKPVLDAASPNISVEFEIPTDGLLLQPGNFYLMHTLERVRTSCYQPSLEGKSSIARLSIQVHFTAGWGEPGFNGQYTLEVGCLLPVRIYAGMRIGQIKFETLEGDIIDYSKKGNYVGQHALGPVASRCYMQFMANAEK
jgi:dCTP deaminase